jgi:hypothetical protein
MKKVTESYIPRLFSNEIPYVYWSFQIAIQSVFVARAAVVVIGSLSDTVNRSTVANNGLQTLSATWDALPQISEAVMGVPTVLGRAHYGWPVNAEQY